MAIEDAKDSANKAARDLADGAEKAKQDLKVGAEKVQHDAAQQAGGLVSTVKGWFGYGEQKGKEIVHKAEVATHETRDSITDAAKNAQRTAQDLANETKASAKKVINDTKAAIVEKTHEAKDAAGRSMKNAQHEVDDLKRSAEAKAAQYKNAAADKARKVEGEIDHKVDEFKGARSKWQDQLGNTSAASGEAARRAIDDTRHQVKQEVVGSYDRVKQAADDTTQKVKAEISQAKRSAADVAHRVEDKAATIAHRVEDRAANVAHRVEDKAANVDRTVLKTAPAADVYQQQHNAHTASSGVFTDRIVQRQLIFPPYPNYLSCGAIGGTLGIAWMTLSRRPFGNKLLVAGLLTGIGALAGYAVPPKQSTE